MTTQKKDFALAKSKSVWQPLVALPCGNPFCIMLLCSLYEQGLNDFTGHCRYS